MKKAFYLILALFLFTGCATVKVWTPMTGSKADGVVTLAYDYGVFQIPKQDPLQAQSAADARCKAWGYSSASAFGGEFKNCINYSSGSCSGWRVTKEFQCIN